MRDRVVCWLDGAVLPARDARISVLDHGLLYGDGVFEGIRFYHRRPFRLQAHLDRLQRSARAIALPLPYGPDRLAQAVDETIRAFDGSDGYLRLVVTRGVGPMGVDPRGCERPGLFVIAGALQLIGAAERARGARVVIAATRRLPVDGLDPRVKSLNYLNAVLARIEANAAGADEAVLLNAQGRVAEASTENLFVVQGGRLITPPTSEGALAGVTRDCVLELAAAAGIDAVEAPLTPYDLYTADECFLTGTGAELIPVREIDGRQTSHCPGPVFSALATAFRRVIDAETQAPADEGQPA